MPTLRHPRALPRNQTALDANPPTSRAESGVNNSHPGLECDLRVLDSLFFPGLRFDFSYKAGARLVQVKPSSPLSGWLESADLDRRPLFLWCLHGTFGTGANATKVLDLIPADGYCVLHYVSDLEQSRIGVLLGPLPDVHGPVPVDLLENAKAKLARLVATTGRVCDGLRDPAGGVMWVAVADERANYVDGGVIDPVNVEPGMLTQSLCSPWQWDFADCGCYYWAASRPDIVIGPDGGGQTQNFQRLVRKGSPPPARDWTHWMRTGTIDQPAMIEAWKTLPVVVAEREHLGPVPLPAPAPKESRLQMPTLADVVQRLRALAELEHALVVMYLYAAYSVALPQPHPSSKQDKRLAAVLAAAAATVMSLARDEMQHMRWANLALVTLGAKPTVARATTIDLPSGRYSADPTPLGDEALALFIEIELPTKDSSGSPTGQYARLQLDIERLLTLGGAPQELESLRRAREIVSLLAKEGIDHHASLVALVSALKALPKGDRLRVKGGPKPSADRGLASLQQAADAAYAMIVNGLGQAYGLPEARRGGLAAAAVAPMRSLDQIGQELAAAGVGLLFTPP